MQRRENRAAAFSSIRIELFAILSLFLFFVLSKKVLANAALSATAEFVCL